MTGESEKKGGMGRFETQTQEKASEDGGRDWNDLATSQGTSGATRCWMRQGNPPLEPW